MKITTVIIFFLLLKTISAQLYDLFDLHKKLFESKGLEVRFLFYSEGNGVKDNGINVLLKNNNPHGISYSFEIIFKSGNKEHKEKIAGILNANEMKTGSTAKLFFLPFKDGTQIKYVGATKIRVNKIE